MPFYSHIVLALSHEPNWDSVQFLADFKKHCTIRESEQHLTHKSTITTTKWSLVILHQSCLHGCLNINWSSNTMLRQDELNWPRFRPTFLEMLCDASVEIKSNFLSERITRCQRKKTAVFHSSTSFTSAAPSSSSSTISPVAKTIVFSVTVLLDSAATDAAVVSIMRPKHNCSLFRLNQQYNDIIAYNCCRIYITYILHT